MIFDSTNKFSSSQAVTATAASTNVIDLGVTGRNAGRGEVIPVDVRVDTTFATLTSLTVSVETDDDEAFGSAVTVISTPAIAAADLVAGYKFNLTSIPRGVTGRYVRLKYTVAGSNATAGAITAGVVAGEQDA